MDTTELRQGQNVLQRESQCHTRHIDWMAQQMTSIMEYSTEFNTSLAQMFSSCGLNAGPPPIQFSAPPMVPQYESEEDDDEDINA